MVHPYSEAERGKILQMRLNATNLIFPWPGLHNLVQRVPPVVGQASPYAAMYNFNWLSAPGTACESSLLFIQSIPIAFR